MCLTKLAEYQCFGPVFVIISTIVEQAECHVATLTENHSL